MNEQEARKICWKVEDRMHIDERFAEGEFVDWIMKNDCRDIDAEQLEIGMRIEMEHTEEPLFAAKIALDHLSEFPDYYTALVEMERMLEERKRGDY